MKKTQLTLLILVTVVSASSPAFGIFYQRYQYLTGNVATVIPNGNGTHTRIVTNPAGNTVAQATGTGAAIAYYWFPGKWGIWKK